MNTKFKSPSRSIMTDWKVLGAHVTPIGSLKYILLLAMYFFYLLLLQVWAFHLPHALRQIVIVSVSPGVMSLLSRAVFINRPMIHCRRIFFVQRTQNVY